MLKSVFVVSELYYPEETSTGYFLTKIAEGLATEYSVTALCSQPTYSARGNCFPYREMYSPSIHFVSGHFVGGGIGNTVQKDRTIEICRGIIDKKLDIHFVASSHVTHIDKELLYWMKKSGCYRIDFGVESGSPDILRNIKKGQTTEQIESTFKLVHEAGIKPRAFLMVGNPGETAGTINETIQLMRRIRPYNSRTAGIIWVLPDTEIYELAKAKGLVSDDTWLQDSDTIYYTGEHTFEELISLKNRLMKGMAANERTMKAYLEYWVRKAYYRYDFLQKLRRFRNFFN